MKATGINSTSPVSTSNGSPNTTAQPTANEFSLVFVVLMAVFMIIMIVVSVMGNFVVCYIVYQKPAMRSAINLLLATLAMADVMTAICCMPFTLVTIITQNWVLGSEFCYVNGVLYSFLISESTLVLVTISIDRYLIIVKRRDTLTPQRAKIYIVASWVGALLLAIPPMFHWGQYVYIRGQLQCSLRFPYSRITGLSYGIFYLSFAFVFPFLLMTYCYLCILKTVRRNSTRVQNHPPVPGGATKMHKPGRMDINYSFKTRAFTTILILFLLFVVCCLPYTAVRFFLLFRGYSSNYMTSELSAVFLWLTYLNCTLKPVIYYLRIAKFREACIDIMPSWCLQIPKCLPGRTIRRIRPQAIYEVDRKIAVSSI